MVGTTTSREPRAVPFLLLIAGLVVLTVGAEALVRGASRLARQLGISPLVVGLTVVAFGTSAPELAVSVEASLGGRPDIAVGNVVGSNVLNVLLILGLSAAIVPLAVSSRLVRLDVPIMVAASALLWLFAADGRVTLLEGIVLVAGLLAYTVLLIVLGRRRPRAEPEVAATTVPKGPRHTTVALLLVGAGLALLGLGARWLVDGAVDIARLLGVGELAIGLTIVAAGTSAPELATSVVASIRRERDIAVGNVVGSNLFNILSVLGVSAIVAPSGLTVADDALRFDVPVMFAVACLCLPIFISGGRISRGEGVLLLVCLVAYEAVVLLHGSASPLAPPLKLAAPLFFVPLLVTGLALTARFLVRRVPS